MLLHKKCAVATSLSGLVNIVYKLHVQTFLSDKIKTFLNHLSIKIEHKNVFDFF